MTLQHYFGTTLLKGCRPLLYRRSYACLYMQSVTLDNRQRGDRRCWIFRERGSVPFTSLYSFCVRILLTIIEEVCGKFFPSTRRQTSHVINMIVIARHSSRETENTMFRRLLSDCLYCEDYCSALHPLICSASKNRMVLDLTNEAVTFSCFIARSQNCEKRLLASSCVSIRPSARMEQLGFHWTDFHEILLSFENLSRKFKSH